VAFTQDRSTLRMQRGRYWSGARTGERRLDAVQVALSCGTGCASCRIEVARLVAEAPAARTRTP
jgi:NAD(P)H-nitrite reductase large subunit